MSLATLGLTGLVAEAVALMVAVLAAWFLARGSVDSPAHVLGATVEGAELTVM